MKRRIEIVRQLGVRTGTVASVYRMKRRDRRAAYRQIDKALRSLYVGSSDEIHLDILLTIVS